jgi:hypothetical protein
VKVCSCRDLAPTGINPFLKSGDKLVILDLFLWVMRVELVVWVVAFVLEVCIHRKISIAG